ARAGERFEKIENLYALAKRIHQRRAPCAHVAQQKSEEGRMILQSRQFREDQAQIFGALRNFNTGELLDAHCVSPVVGHRTKIIEPVGVRHRAEITGTFADLLVSAMQVTKDRFELAN